MPTLVGHSVKTDITVVVSPTFTVQEKVSTSDTSFFMRKRAYMH
jgi:hypothetical protein